MNCKYNNCESCGYSKDCAIFKEYAELKKQVDKAKQLISSIVYMAQCWDGETGYKQREKIKEAKRFAFGD